MADILGDLPEEQQAQVLALMNQEDSTELKDLLQYEEGTAGSIMTTEVFSLPQNTTAADSIRHLQEATEAETVFYIYVTDKEERLTGVLSLRRLLTVPASTPLEDDHDAPHRQSSHPKPTKKKWHVWSPRIIYWPFLWSIMRKCCSESLPWMMSST